MSNTKDLKNYLLKKENAFLLDDSNNGKTIMLSGAWGAGKTHFWKNGIEKELASQLKKKEKACVYVSLYGKDNIEALKNEILFKAYVSIEDESNVKKKAISAFGVGSKIFSFSVFGFKADGKELSKQLEEYNEEKKIEKAESFIEDGGVICLDDFERKSKKIDLNDLFGFISQLAVEMNCKIVIILNSDVFEGKEAEVFRRVKEKTVNKYFYFEPTIEELFESIVSNEKYNLLESYKEDILKAIIETEELNARIYIQVLDNCLEWEREKDLDVKVVRVLVLGSVNFIVNHLLLDYQEIIWEKFSKGYQKSDTVGYLSYKVISFYSSYIEDYDAIMSSDKEEYLKEINKLTPTDFIRQLTLQILEVDNNKKTLISEKSKEEHIRWINDNESKLKALWKYGHRLYYVADVEEEVYNEIAKFIKTGILI